MNIDTVLHLVRDNIRRSFYQNSPSVDKKIDRYHPQDNAIIILNVHQIVQNNVSYLIEEQMIMDYFDEH